jgi:hypothetical protein
MQSGQLRILLVSLYEKAKTFLSIEHPVAIDHFRDSRECARLRIPECGDSDLNIRRRTAAEYACAASLSPLAHSL